MRGIHEAIKVTSPFVSKSRATATTLYNDDAIGDAVGIDLLGYEEALVTVQLGAMGATSLDISLGFADVDDAEDSSFALLTGADFAQILPASANKTYVIRVRAKDVGRYMFVKSVQVGAVAILSSVVVSLGRAVDQPVTQEQTVAFTHESA